MTPPSKPLDDQSQPIDKLREKPKVNQVARIVNSHFLQSPYEGKDWDSVRNDLIDELTALVEAEIVETRIDELMQVPTHPEINIYAWIGRRIKTLKSEALITAEKKKLLEGLSEEAVELWYDGSDINRKLPKPVHAVPTSAVEEEIKKLNQVPSEEPSVDFTQLDPDGVDIDEVIEALPEEPPLEVPSGKDV